METIFYSGIDNYLKHTINGLLFNTEILDVPVGGRESIISIFNEHLQERPGGRIEVLYSGGLDSEAVLISCNKLKIQCTAITMRLMVNQCPINTHDLYYSEKFCRENKVEQTFIDLDVFRFFENGEHIRYLSPYLITEPHVATHFWLLEQCTEFPVIGGDYGWPWGNAQVISPYRSSYCYYDKFMHDTGIAGIGNMFSHSLESNLYLMQTHINLIREFPELKTDYVNIPVFKQALINRLGFGNLTVRLRSYGWDNIPSVVINKGKYQADLFKVHRGYVKNSISWNNSVANIIGEGPRSNDKF